MSTQIQSLIQNVLAVIAGYLVFKGLDSGIATEASGIVMGLVAVVWGIAQKDVNGGLIVSTVRNIVTFVGGLLVAKGKMSTTEVTTWIGLIVALASSILAALHIDQTAQAKKAAEAVKK